MAFTIEAVEQMILREGPFRFEPALESFVKSSPEYAAITEFLTGKAPLPANLALSDLSTYYSNLAYHITDLENPSANDQLLLQLVTHAGAGKWLRDSFTSCLGQFVIDNPIQPAIDIVLGYYRQMGLTAKQLLEGMLMSFNGGRREDIVNNIQGTELMQFLSETLVKHATHKQPDFLRSYTWNPLYLTLLEHSNLDEEAIVFAQKAAVTDEAALPFLREYRDGRYITLFLEGLEQQNPATQGTTQQRFELAIKLCQGRSPQQVQLLVKLAGQYLEARVALPGNLWHEAHALLRGSDDDSQPYLPLSACAFYYLFKHEQELALRLLRALLDAHKFLSADVLFFAYQSLGKAALPYFEANLANSDPPETNSRYFLLLELMKQSFDPADYASFLWTSLRTTNKPLRAKLISILAEQDPLAEARALGYLHHEQAELRLAAAMVLQRNPSPATEKAVFAALQGEQQEEVRDMLLLAVADKLAAQSNRTFVEESIAGAARRGKLSKPLKAWLKETALPSLYYTDGTILPVEAVRFLLYRMSRMKTMRSDPEARLLIKLIDRSRSGEFAKHLINLFIDQGAKSEHKFLMALAALLGDGNTVDKIRTTTNNWLKDNRSKMAEYGIGALALQGGDKALRWVEWYSRKYRSKKAIISNIALQALEDAAEEQGITIQELGDRIVPDFDFEGLFKHFQIGEDSYRAFIDSKFKLSFFDEDNKALKTLPSRASAELKETFKEIAKEVRDVVKSQSSRLEHYLVVQRSWMLGAWRSTFLENPIMFIYATRLLWIVYVDGKLQGCFICQEDTTLVDLEDEEFAVTGNAEVRIAHPILMPDALLQAWKRKFFDLSIESIFPQLDRPVYKLSDADRAKKIIQDFAGKAAVPGAIRGTLERCGWRKGESEDGGSIRVFHFLDYSGTIEAVLEVDGVFAWGFDGDVDPALGRLYFLQAEAGRKGWFNTPTNEADERLIALGDIAPTLYSEVLAAVHSIKLKDAGASA